jgi:hypothetical protein
MVYRNIFGEQSPKMSTHLSNQELKKSVEELKEELDNLVN